LKTTDYSPEGLRTILLNRNLDRIKPIAELRIRKAKEEISKEQFDAQSKEIKSAKGGQVVVIKPTEGSSYGNLVKVLDEMQICSINTYAIVDIKEGDTFLIDNYLQQGALSADIAASLKKTSATGAKKKK
jgi:hypothetical protein